MKEHVFTVKLDTVTAGDLLKLAEEDERSRGDVVRRLIRSAARARAMAGTAVKAEAQYATA